MSAYDSSSSRASSLRLARRRAAAAPPWRRRQAGVCRLCVSCCDFADRGHWRRRVQPTCPMREFPSLQDRCHKAVARYAPQVLTNSIVAAALARQRRLQKAAAAQGWQLGDVRPTLLTRLAEAGTLLDGVLPDVFWSHFECRALSLAGSKVAMRTLTAACSDSARLRDATERAAAGALVSAAAPANVQFLVAVDLTGCFLVGDDEVCARARDSQDRGWEGRREREESQTLSRAFCDAREQTGRDAPRSVRRAALLTHSQLSKAHECDVRRARQTSGDFAPPRPGRRESLPDSRDCPKARARSGAAHAADTASPPPLRLLDVGGNFNMTADGLEGLLNGTLPKLSDTCAGWGSTDTRADASGAANGHARPRKRARDDDADEDAEPAAAWTSRQRGAALGALGAMRELNIAGLQLGVPDSLLTLLAERCARCAHEGTPLLASLSLPPAPSPPPTPPVFFFFESTAFAQSHGARHWLRRVLERGAAGVRRCVAASAHAPYAMGADFR